MNVSIHGSILEHYPQITLVRPLKFGQLYQCQKCLTYWFLQENKTFMHKIRESHLPFVLYWESHQLTLAESVRTTLKSIGGVLDAYSETITVPVDATNISGEQHAQSLVFITKKPPCCWYPESNIRWATELVSGTPSPYALTLDVRRASSEKREEAMGFSPVAVEDRSGKVYTLSSVSNFFNVEGVRGEEVRLSAKPKRWPNRVWPQSPDTYYFADWFDGCENYFCPSSI